MRPPSLYLFPRKPRIFSKRQDDFAQVVALFDLSRSEAVVVVMVLVLGVLRVRGGCVARTGGGGRGGIIIAVHPSAGSWLLSCV